MQAKIRSNEIDIFKGLLIILVVVGHYDSDIVHDVIFLFQRCIFLASKMLGNACNSRGFGVS